MLFFDLPVQSKENRRSYRRFRKYLQSVGFMPMQESVYVKLQRNVRSTPYDIAELKKHTPSEGKVTVLPLTAGDFGKMLHVLGNGFDVAFLCNDIISV